MKDKSLLKARLDHVYEVLGENDFNRSRSARVLEISIRSLHEYVYRLVAHGYDIKLNPQNVAKNREYRIDGEEG